MDLFWLLYYFHIALFSDVPILESLWLMLDRVGHEIDMILARLKPQLLKWDFTFHPWEWTWVIDNAKSPNGRLCQFKKRIESRLTFSLRRGVWSKTFYLEISYPMNSYTSWDASASMLEVFPNRMAWYYALRCFLDPVVLEIE